MKKIEVVAAIICDGKRVFATQRGYGEIRDGWEFPGGKIEPEETPEAALIREIKEELDTEIYVKELLHTVEYDYPEFHLSMKCFICWVVTGDLTLKEHEAARWLTTDTLDSVDWLPADQELVPLIKEYLKKSIYDNLGIDITVGELMKLSESKTIVNRLQKFISKIGYKTKRGVGDEFSQEEAWKLELNYLMDMLKSYPIDLNTHILFEYMLPNENTERPDVIFLFDNKVIVLEFKTIGKTVKSQYVTQFVGYRQILENYHQIVLRKNMQVESYLILSGCNSAEIIIPDDVKNKINDYDMEHIIGKDNFSELLMKMKFLKPMANEKVEQWINAKRVRSEKIWEEGKKLKEELTNGTDQLYSKIRNISYSYLQKTQDLIFDLVKREEKKIIFVSGVPGAGKTLVGLITLFGCQGDGIDARYYTGNGALKDVLKKTTNSNDISMVTSFRRDYVKYKKTCDEEVLIFDEAQRFWSGARNGLNISDAQGILGVTYSKKVTIVCLIGDGQKPMDGEAGIEAWTDGLKDDSSWKVYAPKGYENIFLGCNSEFSQALHLNTLLRAHFVDLSGWVEAVLKGDCQKAKEEIKQISGPKYRVNLKVTRSLNKLYGKLGDGTCILQKLKEKREQEEPDRTYLFGMLCSSKNDVENIKRLTNGKICSLYTSNDLAYDWYSNDCCNVHKISVATETFCQGLEIDLPIVFFGGDYLLKEENEKYSWVMNPSNNARNRYGDELESIMEDTYRILLTRVTEEMIIVIPSGSEFDDTYNFFIKCGVEKY